MYVLTKNKTNAEKLEDCLMQDKKPGIDLEFYLNSPTKQGLPKSETPEGEFYFWYPRDNRVARFDANSGFAGLGCYDGSHYCDVSLGVRAAKQLEQ